MTIPAGILPKSGTELFAFESAAFGITNGVTENVRNSRHIIDAFREILYNDIPAYKRIALRTIDPVDQVIEYIRCTKGDFDCKADIDDDGIVLNNYEYWDCGKRGCCIDEGIVCKLPAGINGTLTIREIEVTKLIVSDLPDKMIADKLGISVNTVAIHRGHIESKLGVFSKAGIASWAVKHNII